MGFWVTAGGVLVVLLCLRRAAKTLFPNGVRDHACGRAGRMPLVFERGIREVRAYRRDEEEGKRGRQHPWPYRRRD